MSANSGIQPTAALAKEFEDSNSFSSSIRCLKVEIIDEHMECTSKLNIEGSDEVDFSKLHTIVEDNKPCYLLFKNDNKKFWRIVHFSPESSSIKNKMLYASSRSALVKALGNQFFIKTDFVDDIKTFNVDANVNDKSDQRQSVQLHHPLRQLSEEEKPYSEREKRLNEIDNLIKSSTSLSKVTQSIQFNWNEEVTEALNGIVNDEHNFVQCVSKCSIIYEITTSIIKYSQSIDIKSETIILESKQKVELREIKDKISMNEPKFTIYKMDNKEYCR